MKNYQVGEWVAVQDDKVIKVCGGQSEMDISIDFDDVWPPQIEAEVKKLVDILAAHWEPVDEGS